MKESGEAGRMLRPWAALALTTASLSPETVLREVVEVVRALRHEHHSGRRGSSSSNTSTGRSFGYAVMEKTMAQSEGGQSPAERGPGIVLLLIATL